jgi:Raf kinase inhibitor-like YbhB/YbcL family protein
MLLRRMLGISSLLPLIAAAGCGADSRGDNESSNGGTAVENATLTKLDLTSDAFQDGQPIPVQNTCDGANHAPTLNWSEPPAGTKSFALVIDDTDAPSGIFRHWGVFDIPASARSIGGEQRIGTEVHNDFGKPGYGGPCPPHGHGLHHYHFKLFALNVDKLGVSPTARIADVENAAMQHAIAQGELVGTYERR